MSIEKKPQPAVETKPEVKTESSAVMDAVRAVATEMIPAAIAAAFHASGQNQPRVAASPRPHVRQVCNVCQQDLRGCEGKHEEIVVYPLRYPEHADFFSGVVLNGVKYLSNSESHAIPVPANAANEILTMVQRFEQNEHEQRVGRSKTHNSGHVSPHGTSFNPANAAWR